MKILCLHGIGTNNRVFKMQTAGLRFELSDGHSYEFVQGVVPCKAAEGLNSLSNAAVDENQYFSYYDIENPTSMVTALEQLDNYIAMEGPFDGVLGYSHGAGLAAMLLIAKPNAVPLKFAIFLSPVSVYDPAAYLERGEVQVLDGPKNGRPRINIPTAVVYGNSDPRKGESEALVAVCDSEKTFVFVHEGGHEIPGISVKSGLPGTVKVARRAISSAELDV